MTSLPATGQNAPVDVTTLGPECDNSDRAVERWTKVVSNWRRFHGTHEPVANR